MSPRGRSGYGVQRPGLMHWIILLCAIVLGGVGFVGGYLTCQSARCEAQLIDRDAAMRSEPRRQADGSLDPDYRDIVIATLQQALDETARVGSMPPRPPEPVQDTTHHTQEE